MLVTQLNNQDPLNPLEGSEFSAQLAQFSSLEQLLGLNKTLTGQGELLSMLAETMGDSLTAQGDMLARLTDSLNRNAATGMIGTQIEVPGNQVRWSGSEEVSLFLDLEAPVSSLELTIRDANGDVVSTLRVDSLESGQQELRWDGTGSEGNPLPEGVYSFDVEAVDAEGLPVGVTPLTRGTVDRVTFGPDGVLVWVDGIAIPFETIRSVGLPSRHDGAPGSSDETPSDDPAAPEEG